MKALAIFKDKSEPFILLKRGFQHCLVAVEIRKDEVVVIDPAAGGLHLWASGCQLVDVAAYYRGEGCTVVETEASTGGSRYSTRWTCVEVVKRVLGVRGFFILTPYQLYRRLSWDQPSHPYP